MVPHQPWSILFILHGSRFCTYSRNFSSNLQVPWVVPPHKVGDQPGDIGNVVKFSREATAKLHAVSKKNGRTITQVMTTLIALVLSEALLKISGKQGDERFNTLASGFKNATVFPLGWNFVNHVESASIMRYKE